MSLFSSLMKAIYYGATQSEILEAQDEDIFRTKLTHSQVVNDIVEKTKMSLYVNETLYNSIKRARGVFATHETEERIVVQNVSKLLERMRNKEEK